MQPLRRRPKQLDTEPLLFAPAGGAGGLVLQAVGERRTGGGPTPGGSVAAETEERAELVPAPTGEAGPDAETRRRARQIAVRLALRRPRRDRRSRRGVGPLASLPYAGSSDDIDLDRTLEMLTERPIPEDTDIIVRERVRSRRSVVLVVDVSGSMKGERVRTAAATVGALSAELAHDDLAVVAFWSDAAVLLRCGEPVRPVPLLDALLRIPARGLTNVGFALGVAQQELRRVPARDARVVLLSDCVHNAGPDPRGMAARLPRLDVLLDVSGERDAELGRDLATAGRGSLCLVRHYRDVAAALGAIFAA